MLNQLSQPGTPNFSFLGGEYLGVQFHKMVWMSEDSKGSVLERENIGKLPCLWNGAVGRDSAKIVKIQLVESSKHQSKEMAQW